jgi:hypothetical protein
MKGQKEHLQQTILYSRLRRFGMSGQCSSKRIYVEMRNEALQRLGFTHNQHRERDLPEARQLRSNDKRAVNRGNKPRAVYGCSTGVHHTYC